MSDDSGPSPEAYGRVTNPERFHVVFAAAEALLDDLTAEYDVVRLAGGNAIDPVLAGQSTLDRVTRLSPPSGQGAPLAVAFSDFPGVRVRFGNWHIESFPACGCDACDDDPEDLVRDLRDKVGAVVAGRFAERLTGGSEPKLQHRFEGTPEDGWGQAGTHMLATSYTPKEIASFGEPAELVYPAWPRKTGGGLGAQANR